MSAWFLARDTVDCAARILRAVPGLCSLFPLLVALLSGCSLQQINDAFELHFTRGWKRRNGVMAHGM